MNIRKKLREKIHPELKNCENEYYSCCKWYEENKIISSEEFQTIQAMYNAIRAKEQAFIAPTPADYSGYPDCRPEYVSAFQLMANLATKSAVEGKPIEVHVPLINLAKGEIIRRAEWNIGLRCKGSAARSTSPRRAARNCPPRRRPVRASRGAEDR